MERETRTNKSGLKCPKCSAERKSDDSECLKCGIIYKKYAASKSNAFKQAFTKIGASSFTQNQPELVSVAKRFPDITPICNNYIDAINTALLKYQSHDFDHAEKIFLKLLEKQPTLEEVVLKYRTKIKKQREIDKIFEKGVRAYNNERYMDSRLIFEKLKSTHGNNKDIEEYLQKINDIIGPPEVAQQKNSDDESPVKCPKCGSTSIATTTKSFDAGSACCGAIFLGPLGLLCGSTNQNSNICQKCGKKWRI